MSEKSQKLFDGMKSLFLKFHPKDEKLFDELKEGVDAFYEQITEGLKNTLFFMRKDKPSVIWLYTHPDKDVMMAITRQDELDKLIVNRNSLGYILSREIEVDKESCDKMGVMKCTFQVYVKKKNLSKDLFLDRIAIPFGYYPCYGEFWLGKITY